MRDSNPLPQNPCGNWTVVPPARLSSHLDCDENDKNGLPYFPSVTSISNSSGQRIFSNFYFATQSFCFRNVPPKCVVWATVRSPRVRPITSTPAKSKSSTHEGKLKSFGAKLIASGRNLRVMCGQCNIIAASKAVTKMNQLHKVFTAIRKKGEDSIRTDGYIRRNTRLHTERVKSSWNDFKHI